MDMTNRLDGARRPPRGNGAAAGPVLRPAVVAQALWRRRGLLLLCGLLAALVAAAMLLSMSRTFTSTAQILIDPRGLKVLDKEIVPQAREPDLSISVIESEMRFIGSELVLQRVIDRLELGQPKTEPQKGSSALAWLQPVTEQIAL